MHHTMLRQRQCPTDPPVAPLNLALRSRTCDTPVKSGTRTPSLPWPRLTTPVRLLLENFSLPSLLTLGRMSVMSPLLPRSMTSLPITVTEPSPLLTLLGQTPRLPGLSSTPPSSFSMKKRLLVSTAVRLLARNYLLLLTMVLAVLRPPQQFPTMPTLW